MINSIIDLYDIQIYDCDWDEKDMNDVIDDEKITEFVESLRDQS